MKLINLINTFVLFVILLFAFFILWDDNNITKERENFCKKNGGYYDNSYNCLFIINNNEVIKKEFEKINNTFYFVKGN